MSLQDRVALVVVKAHIAGTRSRPRARSVSAERARRVENFRLLFQQLGHPVRAGQRALDMLPGAAQIADRLVEHLQVEEEGHQVRHGQRLLEGQLPAKVDDDDAAQRRGELDKRLKGRHQPQRLQQRAPVVVDLDADAVQLVSARG